LPWSEKVQLECKIQKTNEKQEDCSETA